MNNQTGSDRNDPSTSQDAMAAGRDPAEGADGEAAPEMTDGASPASSADPAEGPDQEPSSPSR